MTIEQFFRLQPAEDAIVVRAGDGALRVLARPDVFRASDAEPNDAPGSRKLLRGLVAFRKNGKKR